MQVCIGTNVTYSVYHSARRRPRPLPPHTFGTDNTPQCYTLALNKINRTLTTLLDKINLKKKITKKKNQEIIFVKQLYM